MTSCFANQGPAGSLLRIFARTAIPLFLVGSVAWSVYAASWLIGAHYFLHGEPDFKSRRSTGIVIIVLHAVFLSLFALAVLRLIVTICFNPGYTTIHAPADETEAAFRRRRIRAFGGRLRVGKTPDPYLDRSGVIHHGLPCPPGLELFIAKDVYVCQPDGLPPWCNYCWNWKPDRTHHSSALGRCVKRFDHYCPWIGGAVSETSNKFFLQFVFWFTVYLSYVFAIAIYAAVSMAREDFPDEGDRVHFGFLAGLSGFGIFLTASIFIRFGYLVAINSIASEETIGGVFHLAIRISEQEFQQRANARAPFPAISFPLPGMLSPSPSGPRAIPRHYAILQLKTDGNPWRLSALDNWRQVMGNNPLDWFLPLRNGPVCDHSDGRSHYRLGSDVDELLRVFFPERYAKRRSRRRSSASRQGSAPRPVEMSKARDGGHD